MRWLLTVLSVVLMFSCSNDQEQKLRDKMAQSEPKETKARKSLKGASLEQYKEQEEKLTENYINGLKELIDNSFEKQLEEFEDNELGVIAGYKYMFKYITSSEQEWTDMQLQLSDKYFNTLSVQQMAHEYSNEYIQDIKYLRSQIYTSKKGINTPKIGVLQIPQNKVFVDGLSEHSGTNLAIEIGTNVLEFLLGALITSLISFAIGSILVVLPIPEPISKLAGCATTIISFILMMIISIVCTSYNDGKLMDSLREQKESISIDYQQLEQSLNQNTKQFYDTLK